jgi:anti-sigma B factor antagonist
MFSIRSPLSLDHASVPAVAVFPAEVDVSNAHAIRDDILRLLDRGTGPLVLDLGGTRFCDCAGVSAIMTVDRRATALRTRVCLVLPAGGPVHRIAAMTGLDRRVLTANGVDAARAVLGPACDDAVPR